MSFAQVFKNGINRTFHEIYYNEARMQKPACQIFGMRVIVCSHYLPLSASFFAIPHARSNGNELNELHAVSILTGFPSAVFSGT